MKKTEKIEFTKKLTDTLQSASSYVLVDFAGMDIANQQELKKRLKAVNSKLVVVKNTLLKRAASSAKAPKEMLSDTVLTGQTALVVAEKDPVSPIQILGAFINEFKLPKLKVGVVEGLFQDEGNILKISSLPSKEALLVQVVGTVAAPTYGLVGTLEANLQKLIFILQNVKKSENSEIKGGDKNE